MISDNRWIKIISIPKSLYVSYRLMGWKNAFKLPILVRYDCVLAKIKGKVEIRSYPLRKGLLTIGFCSSGISSKRHSPSIIEVSRGGRFFLEGNAQFGHGTKLIIGPKGRLYLGDGFSSTAEGTFICFNKISIGNNTAVAWFAMVLDTDFHSVENTETGEISAASREINIGNHCWLAARSITLKGAVIPNGCILAANSTAVGVYKNENTLLAGNPACEKKHNITKSTKGDYQFL